MFETNIGKIMNKTLYHYIDLHEWQIAHIEKGVEAAQKKQFASEKEVSAFFKKYDKRS